ncbi:MAG: VOC family protein [Pseudomonadota bacterium]|nr:VOC family protein [Pseudomonadota bacterium]
MSEHPPFHLAFPVTDLAATRRFYRDVLGCALGRESDRWIDFDFAGHQITAHLVDTMPRVPTNSVDRHDVPVSHFGLVLPWDAWEALADRLKDASAAFLIEPHVRFRGQPGEQATLFLLDPSGNGLEFKSFRHAEGMFDRTGSHR